MRLFQLLLLSFVIISCSTDKAISIQDKLQKESQNFFLDASSDTIITGKEGTVIFIEKGSFQNEALIQLQKNR